MRIQFVTTAHNSLSQRAQVELIDRGHEVRIELARSDEGICAAVERFQPDLILCPMLKTALPKKIWRNFTCLIVHPGIKGDRGPSSLDWAILNETQTWGATVLQAIETMDAGDIWASYSFQMRQASKSSIYRNEVVEAAIRGILESIDHFMDPEFIPEPLNYENPAVQGRLHIPIKQEHRKLNWNDATTHLMRNIRSADSSPGVLDSVLGEEYFLFGAHPEGLLKGRPGELLAQHGGAICRATGDGALWISHLKKRKSGSQTFFKLPAVLALQGKLSQVPRVQSDYREIWYEEQNEVGYLYFDFYNGAMSTEQCRKLHEAYLFAKLQNTKVLALMGGKDFWSNGIHLNVIEAAQVPADESWENINAINDLVCEIITTDQKIVVSAVRGNAGAGGVILALAADRVFAREGIVLNPHYKGMGGLYGSEYWTYLLPRRVGREKALELTESCLPIGTSQALRIELIDEAFGPSHEEFLSQLFIKAENLAHHPEYQQMLELKQQARLTDEQRKPLQVYRSEELEKMKVSFYGPDPSYHEARRKFVYKILPEAK